MLLGRTLANRRVVVRPGSAAKQGRGFSCSLIVGIDIPRSSPVDTVEWFSYNIPMKTKKAGRPPKSKGERKDVDLRIPVTSDQKEAIAEAARVAGMDMAAWARPILLAAAQGEQGSRK